MNRAGCALMMFAGLVLAPVASVSRAADEPTAWSGTAHAEGTPAQQVRLGDLAARRADDDGSGGNSATSGSLKSMLGLGAVLILILGGAGGVRWLARRQGGLMASIGPGGRAPAGLLEVLGRYPVARGQTLVLIKLDRRVLLLSQSIAGRGGSSGFNTLAEFTDSDEVASILMKSREESGDSISHRFKSFLAGEEARPWESESRLAGDEAWDDHEYGGFPESGEENPPQYSGVGLLRERVESLRRSAEGGTR